MYEIENDGRGDGTCDQRASIEKREDNGFFISSDIFQVLDNNREIVSALVGPYGDMRFIQKVEVILARNSREVLEQMFRKKVIEMDYFYAYCLNGCLGFVKTGLPIKSLVHQSSQQILSIEWWSVLCVLFETREEVGVYHALLVKCNKRAFPILVHSFIDGKVSKGYN